MNIFRRLKCHFSDLRHFFDILTKNSTCFLVLKFLYFQVYFNVPMCLDRIWDYG